MDLKHCPLLTMALALAISLPAFSQEGKSVAGEVGYEEVVSDIELPKKLGVSGTWVWQEQGYRVDSFAVTGVDFDVAPGLPVFATSLPSLTEASVSSIENEVTTYSTKLDYWLLPFLNVYGILGDVEGEVDVALDFLPDPLSFDYSGFVYGVGGVVAAGYKDVFFSTDVTYTITDLDDGFSMDTLVISPKVGIKKGDVAVWVGATRQMTSHEQAGTIALPPLNIGYQAVLTDEHNWNYTAGFQYSFTENLDLTVEGGFGERKQALVSLGLRF